MIVSLVRKAGLEDLLKTAGRSHGKATERLSNGATELGQEPTWQWEHYMFFRDLLGKEIIATSAEVDPPNDPKWWFSIRDPPKCP